MAVHTVRLPVALAARLERLAQETRRSKSSFIVEALELYFAEREDLETALARLRDPQAETMDHDDVRRALDLD